MVPLLLGGGFEWTAKEVRVGDKVNDVDEGEEEEGRAKSGEYHMASGDKGKKQIEAERAVEAEVIIQASHPDILASIKPFGKATVMGSVRGRSNRGLVSKTKDKAL